MSTGNFAVSRGSAVTPNDGADIPATSGLYIGGAGNVSVVFAPGDAPVTLTALAVGVVHRLQVTRVRATGTTATGIVALY